MDWQTFISAWIDFAMITGPVTGYFLQYRLIAKNKSVGAFSIDICLVLLFANILRINFFLFQRYELPLFYQSLLMITAQILLLRTCIRYKPNVEAQQQQFWRWNCFSSYAKYILVFALGTLGMSTVFKIIDLPAYGDLVGLAALLSESLLILPQIIQINRKKSARGISYSLIGLNLLGDIFKTGYFFVKQQPFQFKLCGIIQLLLDFVVIAQIVYFSRSSRDELAQPDNKGTEKEVEIQVVDSVGSGGSGEGHVPLQEQLQEGVEIQGEVINNQSIRLNDQPDQFENQVVMPAQTELHLSGQKEVQSPT